jgi:putative NADH-flavin reductase
VLYNIPKSDFSNLHLFRLFGLSDFRTFSKTFSTFTTSTTYYNSLQLTMKIAIFGASGRIGSRIVNEALSRGHEVTAVVRHPETYTLEAPHLRVAKGDLFDSDDVESGVFNHDAVVSAFNFKAGVMPPATIKEVATPLLKGLKQAGVKRLLVVGGAGSLKGSTGEQLVDMPDFPAAYKESALAQREALKVYQHEKDIEWTYLSPAAETAPGERTGKFRTGTDQVIVGENGHSFISMEDYAVAVIDELENPMHIREQFTVGY